MPKTIVLDELLVTVRVPAALPDRRAVAARRVLTEARFMSRLRKVVRAEPDLAVVRVTVTR